MATVPLATSHRANLLLAALSAELYAKLEPHLRLTELRAGVLLYRPGERIRDIYFPHDCVLSLVAAMRDGDIAEMATIGREGMLDALSWRDSGRASARTIVQIGGHASVIDNDRLAELYGGNAEMRDLSNRYVESMLRQALQLVACNAVHSVEARACRWILMTHDRVARDRFSLTHELMAQMLGAQRPTVSIVARTLQTARLIKQERGSITVLDRRGLEESACECYEIMREAFSGTPDAPSG